MNIIVLENINQKIKRIEIMINKIELTHEHHCIDGYWYWVCPICKEWLCPHEAGKGKGHFVLHSKGIATKHLIAHNAGYVVKGKSTTEIINQNQYFCNKCNESVLTKRTSVYLMPSTVNWKHEHKFVCCNCANYENWDMGLKTKEEVHKGKK